MLFYECINHVPLASRVSFEEWYVKDSLYGTVLFWISKFLLSYNYNKWMLSLYRKIGEWIIYTHLILVVVERVTWNEDLLSVLVGQLVFTWTDLGSGHVLLSNVPVRQQNGYRIILPVVMWRTHDEAVTLIPIRYVRKAYCIRARVKRERTKIIRVHPTNLQHMYTCIMYNVTLLMLYQHGN